MTTIPHHNITMMQAPYALNLLNTQISALSPSELAESNQAYREELQRSVAQRLEELLRVTSVQEEPPERNRNLYRGRGVTSSAQRTPADNVPGSLVDIYA